jgi:arylsulfatase A
MKPLNRRTFLKSLGTGAAAMTAARRSRAAEPARRTPNVLLVLTDDQGWGDIHSHGNEKLDTPVLDRLAADGARFDRFFVSPLCAPTRASMLTGRHYLRTGVSGVCGGKEVMRSSEVTIAQALKGAGYATGCFGKWHNGEQYPEHPRGKGFDEFFGFCGGNWDHYFDPTLERDGAYAANRGYITDIFTDAALAFLEKHRDRPFFCYVAYNAPHGPFQVPGKYFDKYIARGFDAKNAAVCGMVENVDWNVGRLLGKLDDLGLAEDTIVLFLTDNGPNGNRFNGGMRGIKGSADEGGCRVPCFIRWPRRIRPGTVIRPIAGHVDLLPTLADACGAKGSKTLPLDGVSLMPLLEGRAADWPDRMLFEKGAVRTQQWRFMAKGKGGGLYDMVADPGQQKDVTRDHPDVAARLAAAYAAWEEEASKGQAGMPPPICVGYREAPIVWLTTHRAAVRGSIQRLTPWTSGWLTAWTKTDGAVEWDIDVVEAGRFEAALWCTVPETAVGTKVRLEAGPAAVEGRMDKAHDPPPLDGHDRVKRGESYAKAWAADVLGPIALAKGRARLVLKVTELKGPRAMDLKAVRLVRLG